MSIDDDFWNTPMDAGLRREEHEQSEERLRIGENYTALKKRIAARCATTSTSSEGCPNCGAAATGPGLAFTDGTICNEPTHVGSTASAAAGPTPLDMGEGEEWLTAEQWRNRDLNGSLLILGSFTGTAEGKAHHVAKVKRMFVRLVEKNARLTEEIRAASEPKCQNCGLPRDDPRHDMSKWPDDGGHAFKRPIGRGTPVNHVHCSLKAVEMIGEYAGALQREPGSPRHVAALDKLMDYIGTLEESSGARLLTSPMYALVHDWGDEGVGVCLDANGNFATYGLEECTPEDNDFDGFTGLVAWDGHRYESFEEAKAAGVLDEPEQWSPEWGFYLVGSWRQATAAEAVALKFIVP